MDTVWPEARTYVHAVRWLRMRFFNFTLIGMRWATPLIIMVADTILAYTWSRPLRVACSRRGLGVEIVEWSDMVRRIEDSVRLLDTRVLADRRKLDESIGCIREGL